MFVKRVVIALAIVGVRIEQSFTMLLSDVVAGFGAYPISLDVLWQGIHLDGGGLHLIQGLHTSPFARSASTLLDVRVRELIIAVRRAIRLIRPTDRQTPLLHGGH